MRSFREVQAELNSKMTDGEREEYSHSREETRRRIELAQMFYEARKDAGLNQKQLAERMGTKQSVISRIEQAGTTPSIETMDRLADATGKKVHIGLTPA